MNILNLHTTEWFLLSLSFFILFFHRYNWKISFLFSHLQTIQIHSLIMDSFATQKFGSSSAKQIYIFYCAWNDYNPVILFYILSYWKNIQNIWSVFIQLSFKAFIHSTDLIYLHWIFRSNTQWYDRMLSIFNIIMQDVIPIFHCSCHDYFQFQTNWNVIQNSSG